MRPQEPVRSPSISSLPTIRNLAGGKALAGGKGIWQPLYDTILLAQGSVNDESPIQFFALGHTAGRDWIDTNVPQAGKLPGGVTFSIRGMVAKIVPESGGQMPTADILRFSQGLFTLKKGDGVLFRLHNVNLGGLGGFGGPEAGGASIFQTGGPAIGDYFRYPHPDYYVALPAEVNFSVEMNWRPAPLAFEPTQNYKVTVYLIGDYTGPIDY